MYFDEGRIQELFRDFWRKNKTSMMYYYKGKQVVPEKISGCSVQLAKGDYSDRFVFRCQSLNLRVQIDKIEKPYTARFYLKVLPVQNQSGDMPTEIIAEIKDNKINLED